MDTLVKVDDELVPVDPAPQSYGSRNERRERLQGLPVSINGRIYSSPADNSDNPTLPRVRTTQSNTSVHDCNRSGGNSSSHGYPRGTPDPAGGTVQRDKDGKLNGVLRGAVFRIVWPSVARAASMKEKEDAIQSPLKAFNAMGYTGIDLAMDDTIWEPLVALRNDTNGLQGMRIAAYWLTKPTDSPDKLPAQVDAAAELARQHSAETTTDCRVGGVKVITITDGIMDTCAASQTEPHYNGENADSLWPGHLRHHVVARVHATGFQVALPRCRRRSALGTGIPCTYHSP
ncbi:amidohydrolase family protein [Metarhizium album ARSEF 1941]|uniref:Amidohydrolase family protein n=1 Tax=Metarhizium album (strain ARSEF 1941) TaxID=1081103 RepID=A0A0B2WU46_METAS|nr:amidohydrolase family protein [Metarhizium album ARSEF 1941]KHN97588.1 amidohydrolase family protein [Metarhizium album ARSEF 1941]